MAADKDMAADNKSGESFLSRWSRRKVEVVRGVEAPAPATAPQLDSSALRNPGTAAPVAANMPQDAREETTRAATSPPLPPIESLSRESDFVPFMRAEVAPEMRNLAMKKLFTDPHYNVMDRLDIYIDDYGKPDPIPPAMLRMMNQSKALGLFEEEERAEEAARKRALGEDVHEENPPDGQSGAQAALPADHTATAAGPVADTADNRTFPFAPLPPTPAGSAT